MRHITTAIAMLGLIGLTLGACDKKAETTKPAAGETKKTAASEAKNNAEAKPATDKAQKPAAEEAKKSGSTAAAGEQGKALLAAYEKVRIALAKDDWEGTKAAAKTLGEWAKAHASKMDASFKPHLEGIASSATKMVDAADIEASRGEAFGGLSKHTISIVVKASDLGEGVQVYRCPMAKAYKKWLQLDAEMANPYMGKRMLKCGGKVKTEV